MTNKVKMIITASLAALSFSALIIAIVTACGYVRRIPAHKLPVTPFVHPEPEDAPVPADLPELDGVDVPANFWVPVPEPEDAPVPADLPELDGVDVPANFWVPVPVPEPEDAPESLKGKYKIEDKKEECPVCYYVTNVVKPFVCPHGVCENCLDSWSAKRHKDKVYENGVSVPLKVNCPTCRTTELREPDNRVPKN